jgi:hypothetical protein
LIIFVYYIVKYAFSNIVFCEIAVYSSNLSPGVCEAVFDLFSLNF